SPELLPGNYFRKQLIFLIYSRIHSGDIRVLDDIVIREINPGKATVSLSKLLGKEGVELYKYALQEEVSSREYRLAVANDAISHIEGNKTMQRPIIYVAGPSGCG